MTNMETAATPLYGAAARAYLTAGWPSVLPLPHAAKTPPPGGYTGRQGAWPTPDQIDQWADSFPDGNLALRLPDDVIGIDVDAYGNKPGGDTLARLETELGPLPATLISTSRTDGTSGIRLFRTPRRPSWHDPGPGIEIIHSGWRYVIAAPSIHDRTGASYRWIDQATGELVTGAPPLSRLPELPDSWAQRLSTDQNHQKADVSAGEVATWLAGLAAGTPCTATRNTVRQFHVDLTAGGARHDAMLDATGRIVRAIERGHQGGPAALSEAQTAFLTAVTGDGTRTLTDAQREWQRALDGAYALVAATPTPPLEQGCRCGTDGPLPPLTTLPAPDHGTQEPAGDQPDPATDSLSPLEQLRTDPAFQTAVAEEATRIVVREDARLAVTAQKLDLQPPPPLIGLTDFLNQPDPDIVYRVDQLWPAGGRVLLAAQYKAGKTTAVGNLLRALVDGDPFLGTYPVAPPDGKVVLIDDELHETTLRRWLRDQNIDNTGQVDLVSMRGRLSTFDILDPTVRTAWADQLRTAGAAIVILDCLRPIIDALGLSEDKDVGKVLTALDELLHEAGVDEAVIVHHMGHSGERSRGDSRLRDWPDAEWKIVRQTSDDADGTEDPTAKRFFSALGRDVLVEESELALDPDGRRLTIVGGSRRDAKTRGVVDAVIAAVQAEPGLNTRALRAVVREAVDCRNEDVDKARDRAWNDHLIRVERGRNRAMLHHPAVVTIAENGPDSDPGVPSVPRCAPAHGHTASDRCARVPIGGTGTHRPHDGHDNDDQPTGHTQQPIPPGHQEIPT